MKNYVINSIQYHTIPTIMRVSQRELALKIGVDEVYMSRRIEDGNFTIKEALQICNIFRIPLSRFIVVGAPELRTNGLRVADDEWTDLHFERDALKTRMEGITYTAVCKATGWSRPTVDGVFNDECKMGKFIKFCNAMRFNMSDFFGDVTMEDIEDEPADLAVENEKLRAEVKELRAVLSKLRKRVKELENKKNGSL